MLGCVEVVKKVLVGSERVGHQVHGAKEVPGLSVETKAICGSDPTAGKEIGVQRDKEGKDKADVRGGRPANTDYVQVWVVSHDDRVVVYRLVLHSVIVGLLRPTGLNNMIDLVNDSIKTRHVLEDGRTGPVILVLIGVQVEELRVTVGAGKNCAGAFKCVIEIVET